MNQHHADARQNEATPRVVVLKTWFRSTKNYNYLVIDPTGQRAVVVDPAWQTETIERAVIESQARLSGILVTHSHPDHIDLAQPLAEKYACPIWMSKEEIAASGFDSRQLVAIDTNPITVGQLLIEPILTPGHTPGGMCYLIGDNLFSGDVLFAEGCGICPNTQAAHAMFASLQTLKNRLKPQTRVYPGHSYGMPPGQTLAQLLRDNIYLQFSDKHSFAAFRLRSGQNTSRMFSFS
jgi:hydroxyacylglutathione hydrolase